MKREGAEGEVGSGMGVGATGLLAKGGVFEEEVEYEPDVGLAVKAASEDEAGVENLFLEKEEEVGVVLGVPGNAEGFGVL